MKSLFLVLMLLMAVLLPLESMAVPKHGRGAHARQQSASAAADAASEPDNPAPPPPPVPAWKATLGAATIAIGAGGLAAHLGIDPAILALIGIAVIVVLIVVVLTVLWWRRRKKGRFVVYAGDYLNSIMAKHGSRSKSKGKQGKASKTLPKAKPVRDLPVGFDLPTFLARVEGYFLLAQGAWDRGDVEDMREFTSQDMLLAFELQILKRKDRQYETTVESLEVDLIRLECSGDYLATVQFSGMIQEESHSAKEFVELWYLQKPSPHVDKWVLTGIRQLP